MGKSFYIGDILGVITGHLLYEDGLDGTYKLLNFMLDTSVYTHEIPKAEDICRIPLLKQLPEILCPEFFQMTTKWSDGDKKGADGMLAKEILEWGIKTFGDCLIVEKITNW
jgi:hypothetical protein